jgi:hypothetical protein
MVRIHRLEFDKGGCGFQVVMKGGGTGRTLYFSDGKYGSKRKAQDAAHDCAAALTLLMLHFPDLTIDSQRGNYG